MRKPKPIVILDACRNNPFERSWSRSANGNGLASLSAPLGTFVAYATAPGTTASDGTSGNGLFTQSLLQYMSEEGLELTDVFKRVTRKVIEKSNKKQIPWVSSNFTGDFYFKK